MIQKESARADQHCPSLGPAKKTAKKLKITKMKETVMQNKKTGNKQLSIESRLVRRCGRLIFRKYDGRVHDPQNSKEADNNVLPPINKKDRAQIPMLIERQRDHGRVA